MKEEWSDGEKHFSEAFWISSSFMITPCSIRGIIVEAHINPITEVNILPWHLAYTLLGNITLRPSVVKMASHGIFQYNVLVIDDTHNTWTNIIVKINIPRLLGSSDDKEKRGVARPEGFED